MNDWHARAKEVAFEIITDTNHVCNGINIILLTSSVRAVYIGHDVITSWYRESMWKGACEDPHTAHTTSWVAVDHCPSFFYMRNRGLRAPRRQGEVARAICPQPDCGSATTKKKKMRRVKKKERERRIKIRPRKRYPAGTRLPRSHYR